MKLFDQIITILLSPLFKTELLASKYRRVLLVRFTGYLLLMIGMTLLGLLIEPVIGEEAKFNYRQLSGQKYIVPNIVTSSNTTNGNNSARLGDIKVAGGDVINPVSTDFGIVIEKIGANAMVIGDVDTANEASYISALQKGVAHAKGTVYPGQNGNIFLFSHSTDAPWNVVRYNAIFFLLSKLERQDRIIMFYQGRRYDYTVFDKVIAKSTDVQYLTNTYDQSILTLQTCDPPGTTLNRLIVRAKLSSQPDPSI